MDVQTLPLEMRLPLVALEYASKKNLTCTIKQVSSSSSYSIFISLFSEDKKLLADVGAQLDKDRQLTGPIYNISEKCDSVYKEFREYLMKKDIPCQKPW